MMPSWLPATPPEKGRALARCSCHCDPQDTGRFHVQSLETMQRNGGVTPPFGGQGPSLTSPLQGSTIYPPPQPLSEGCATHDAAKAMANSTATGCQACGLPAPSPLLWCPRLGPNGGQGGVAGRPRGVGQVEHHGGAQGPGPPTPSLERTSTEPQGEEEGASRTSYTIVGICTSFPLPVSLFEIPDRSFHFRASFLFLLSYIKNQQGCVKLRLLFDFFLWRPDHCVGRGWIGYDEGVGRPRMGYRSGR